MKYIPLGLRVFGVLTIPIQLFVIFKWLYVLGIVSDLPKDRNDVAACLTLANFFLSFIISLVVHEHSERVKRGY